MKQLKSVFIFVLLIFICFDIKGQSFQERIFYKDISYEYGLYNSANSGIFVPSLRGQLHSITAANYYTQKFGFRTGIEYVIYHTENELSHYSVPLYMTYKTRIGWQPPSEINIFEAENFVFQLLLGLLPRNVEFYLGTKLGSIDSDSSPPSLRLGNKFIMGRFILKNSFLATLDGGMRMFYQIKRVGIILHPALSYHLQKNFSYTETYANGINNTFTPQLFLRATIGLSYRF